MEPQFIKVENRRMGDQSLSLIAAKLDTLHGDVSELKTGFNEGLKEIAAAITKLAVIEAQQRHGAETQGRTDKTLDEIKSDLKDVSVRVASLETVAPMQKKTSDWILAAVWGGAGLTVATIAHKAGLI